MLHLFTFRYIVDAFGLYLIEGRSMRIQFEIPRINVALLTLLLLSGCGGGDGTSSSAGPGDVAVTLSSSSFLSASPSPPSLAPIRVETDYHLTYSNESNTADVSTWSTSDFWGMRNNYADYQAQWFADPLRVPSYSTKAAYNPFSAMGSVLAITARPTPANTFAGEDNAGNGGQPYVSGQLTTAHRFTQRYGYFELRAKLPPGKGLWSRFWLLTDDGQWPGEYDVLEVLGKESNIVHQTTHFRTATNPHVADGAAYTGINPVDGQFHTYGFLWTKTGVTWYVDRVPTLTQPNRINIPMYALIDLAVGRDPENLWPGDPDSSTALPKAMEIDYFRVYSNDAALPAAVPQAGYTASVLPAGLNVVSAPTVATLPTGWTAGSIGSPELKGTSSWNATTGEWILKGAGYSNFGQFAGASLASNGQITATVDSITTMNSNDVRGGVAMRNSRSNSSPEISLVYITSHNSSLAPGNTMKTRIVMQSRGSGNPIELASVTIAPGPVTLRLLRQGNVLTGRYSGDGGATWKAVGQTTSTSFPGSVLASLFVGGNSENYLRLSRANFSNVTLEVK